MILHEQNAVLGRANRFLARHADMLALSFAATERVPAGAATVVTGNPVRPAIAALASAALRAADGHAAPAGAGWFARRARVQRRCAGGAGRAARRLRARLSVVQQCRAEDWSGCARRIAAAGIAAELSPFFPDVAEKLAAAHLVIARAGASTVAELAVAGRPAILVPLPGAIDDHQTANAARWPRRAARR